MSRHEHHETDEPRRGLAHSTWVLIGFLAIAAYFVFSEHRAHFIQFLPFLLLAACPLMHLLHGHGGHGEHSHGGRGEAHDRKARTHRPRSEGDSQ
jgi:hypothetical protein